LLTLANSDSASWDVLLDDPDFLALPNEFPCFVRPEEVQNFAPELMQRLEKAGIAALGGDVALLTEPPPSALPASVKWIAGNWFKTPAPKPPGNRATSRLLALELLELVTADGDIRDIEAVFRRDPTLSYHLLRIVNSVGVGSGRKISSLSQAILVLGRQQLKRWLSLLLFSSSKDDKRADMLLAQASVRARSLELLAKTAGLDRSWQELSFMAGMFSLLGVLFGLPLPEILKPLQISDVLVNALLRHENDLGSLLRAEELAEAGSAAELPALLEEIGVSPTEFSAVVVEAHLWLFRFARAQQDAGHG
jgi:EAL and modified HD-GYP domain-containing signal transduction protein